MKRVRVSVANLAWFIRIRENNIRYPFAILNPGKLEKGKHWYMALGGGAMLTEQGKNVLERAFSASNFELDKTTGLYDARFQVDEEHLEAVLLRFTRLSGTTHSFEHNATFDIMQELSGKEFPDYGCILTEEETKQIQPVFLKSLRQKQPKAGSDTSSRASTKMSTHRLFRIYELMMSKELYQRRIMNSPVIKILDNDELETTKGGSKAGRTKDGCVLQNNLFLMP